MEPSAPKVYRARDQWEWRMVREFLPYYHDEFYYDQLDFIHRIYLPTEGGLKKDE